MQDKNTVPIASVNKVEIASLANLGLPPRYDVQGMIGAGGMGIVIKAQDRELGIAVAIKLLDESVVVDEEQVRRFAREAKMLGQLDHLQILQIKSFGVTETGRPYQVTEFLEGKNLQSRIKEGPLSPSEFKAIFLQLIDALEYAATKSVVHRDIKPSNIFLTGGIGNPIIVKLLDFGIARVDKEAAETKALTATGLALGSPQYMSPEQCRGMKVDFRSDIYSLGCVMYECLAGKPPFEGETPLETMYQHVTGSYARIYTAENSGQSLSKIIDKCLSKEPEQRPQSYSELREALQSCLEKADEGTLLTTLSAPSKKSRRTLAFGSIFLFICILAAGFGYYGCKEANLRQRAIQKADVETKGPIFDEIKAHREHIALQKAVLNHPNLTPQQRKLCIGAITYNAKDLGQKLYQVKRYAEAEKALVDGLSYCSDNSTEQGLSHIYIAKSILRRSDWTRLWEAENHLKTGVSLLEPMPIGVWEPFYQDRADARREYCLLLMLTNRDDEAKASFDKCFEFLNRIERLPPHFDRQHPPGMFFEGSKKAEFAYSFFQDLKPVEASTPAKKLIRAEIYMVLADYVNSHEGVSFYKKDRMHSRAYEVLSSARLMLDDVSDSLPQKKQLLAGVDEVKQMIVLKEKFQKEMSTAH